MILFAKISILATIISVSTLGNIVFAQPITELYQGQYDGKVSENIEKQTETEIKRGNILAVLNLSENQKQRMEIIRRKYQALISPQRENLQRTRQELTNLMIGNSTNSVIRSKHQEVSRLQQRISNLYFESVLEMREILTPTQRTRLAQIIEENKDSIRNRLGSR